MDDSVKSNTIIAFVNNNKKNQHTEASIYSMSIWTPKERRDHIACARKIAQRHYRSINAGEWRTL